MKVIRPPFHPYSVLLVLWLALCSFSPSSSIVELQQLYQNGQYETCMEKASSYIAEHPDEARAYVLVAVPSLMISFTSDGKKADNALKTALKYALEARMRDTHGNAFVMFDWEMGELHRITQETADELYNSVHKQSSTLYFKYLAEIFQDTTDEYREFFVDATPVSMKNEGIGNEVAPDISERKTEAVISFAESLMGIRYRSSGTTPAGFDCSGYVSYVFGKCDIKLPHGSQSQSVLGTDVPLTEARKGDLIFFGSRNSKGYHTNHVGIVHSNNNGQVSFIHSSTSEGVTIDGPNTISWDYWKPRILFVKRIVE